MGAQHVILSDSTHKLVYDQSREFRIRDASGCGERPAGGRALAARGVEVLLMTGQNVEPYVFGGGGLVLDLSRHMHKIVAIDPDGEVELKWRDPVTVLNGDYTARITIVDEQPPEVETDSFRVR